MLRLDTKPDLVAQTHEAIRSAIVAGDLAPCAPLAQENLAETLGVSRQPISHALVLLRQEGLIVDRGRKGQMVAPIEADKLLGLYQVRGALDRLAARLAAKRSDPGAKTGLLDLLEQGRAAVATGSITDLADTDIAFHSAINELSGNAEIPATATSFWPHMARAMRVVLQDESRWDGIWMEHEGIANAIIVGDVDSAGALAVLHAEKAGEATYRRLKEDA